MSVPPFLNLSLLGCLAGVVIIVTGLGAHVGALGRSLSGSCWAVLAFGWVSSGILLRILIQCRGAGFGHLSVRKAETRKCCVFTMFAGLGLRDSWASCWRMLALKWLCCAISKTSRRHLEAISEPPWQINLPSQAQEVQRRCPRRKVR